MRKVRINSSANHDPGYSEVLRKMEQLKEYLELIQNNFQYDWEENPIDSCQNLISDLQLFKKKVDIVIAVADQAIDEQEELY